MGIRNLICLVVGFVFVAVAPGLMRAQDPGAAATPVPSSNGLPYGWTGHTPTPTPTPGAAEDKAVNEPKPWWFWPAVIGGVVAVVALIVVVSRSAGSGSSGGGGGGGY
jgi:hypothetical protein